MDELAELLDLDPCSFAGETTPSADQGGGKEYTSKRLLACYDRAEELSGWRDRDRLLGDGRIRRGMGCATQYWWGGGAPPAYAEVRIGRHRPAGALDRSAGSRHRHHHRQRDRRRRAVGRTRRVGQGAGRSPPGRPRADVGRLDDALVDRPGRTLGRAPRPHPAPRARLRPVRDRGLRPDPRRRRGALHRRHPATPDHRGDGQARQRLGHRARFARAQSRRLRGQHLRLPDRRGVGRYGHGRGHPRPARGGARRRPHHQPDGRPQPGARRDHAGHRLRHDRGAGGRSHHRHRGQPRPRGLQDPDDGRHSRDPDRVHRRPRSPHAARHQGPRRAAHHPHRGRDRKRDRPRHRRTPARGALHPAPRAEALAE